MHIKPHFIFDANAKSRKLQKLFLVKYKTYSLKKANLIVVLGGDGFMLNTLKRLRKNNKPFYGINTGTYGFLMNKPKTKELLKFISKAKPITISPLEMVVKTKNNKLKKGIAVNEVSIFRQSKQASSLTIIKCGFIFIYKFGALGQTRTGTPKRARILSPLCLPISPRGHLFINKVIL